MRRRNIKDAETKLLAYPDLIINNYIEYRGRWQEAFAKKQPIYLEIGMGKGNFIIEHAKRHPEINYIGMEKFASVILQAGPKVMAQNETLPNLKLICEDATNLLKIFKEGEISKIFLNFSDPWPKSRHDKRRLTHINFLKIYENILTKDGIIEFKTDNMSLFEYSLKSFNEAHWFFMDISLDLHHRDEDIITTEYEDKFIAKGNPIYYLQVKK